MGSNFNCSYMALSSSRYLIFSKFIPIRHIMKKIKSRSSTQKFELNDIHAALRRKSKDWFARNLDNVCE
jgi:hypothetical protein